MFAFMPEDDFGIKLKASKKFKKIEMFFLTLCLLFIIALKRRYGILATSLVLEETFKAWVKHG